MNRKFLFSVLNALHRISVHAAIVILVSIVLVILVNVFMRYLFNSGLQWAEEVARLLLVWFTFICMAIGIRRNLHISLHLLPSSLPRGVNIFLVFLKNLIILGIASIFIVYGIRLIGFTGGSIMPATKLPGSALYFILPFSGLLIISETVAVILESNKGGKAVSREEL